MFKMIFWIIDILDIDKRNNIFNNVPGVDDVYSTHKINKTNYRRFYRLPKGGEIDNSIVIQFVIIKTPNKNTVYEYNRNNRKSFNITNRNGVISMYVFHQLTLR